MVADDVAVTNDVVVTNDVAVGDDQAVSVVAAAADIGQRWPLTPLPVMALPGWCPQNLDPGFYDDATVFRSGAVRRRR